MGLMNNPAADGRLIVTPHPVLVDGQRNVVADLRPGESLYRFLMRHMEDLDGQRWEVRIGGKAVPRHLWHHVYPKHGQLIELRGGVGKAAIAIVAMIALTYFTFGIGTAAASGLWGAAAVSSTYGALAATAVYMAGAVLINQVLAPKQPKASQAAPTSYSISAGRNRARAYEPYGLAFGSIRIAPDLISQPYTHYEGDDQYLSMVLTPGINVDSVEAIYNGEALLSSYEGVQIWHNGFPGMPSQELPLYGNADVRDGGTLLDTSSDPKGRPGAWVQRSSSANAVRLMVGVEFQLYDKTSKGKDKANQEQVQIQYRPAGATGWQNFGNYTVRGSTAKTQRASYAIDVAEGQYDVRVRVAGQNTDGSGAQASFTWTTLTSIQRDAATYSGIPRIGIRMKATGQLNGAPDELRTVVHARPVPVWKGDRWVTERSSNPGAQILAYARGIYAPDGTLLAGMALPDRQIDIEGLKAFMLHCEAEGFTYNHWVTDVRSHQQVLDVVALAGFGQVCWPRGRLSVAWAADEQPLSGVVNMATIKKGQFQVDYMLANTADGIEYSYLDGATWEAKTLRVPAPGVTTMLNPAQVTGEGVTTEAHAAMLARWHLAQTLYQYKSIGYSTDIEHLSYSRMSMLALQHDMTQWGFGGRIMGAAVVNGRMVLQLDEAVPAPPQDNAFVGLRIPGERVYRVLRVEPFTGTAKELTLVEPWPRDAAVPGNTEANPAWDTLWIYDFKQTPGLRVRVTGIRPESDLKGAAVEVVAESREFWHYVKTGEYIPSPNDSLLQTRPVASELKITERQVVQGDTEFTELQATYAVSGPVGDTMVLSDLDGNGELEEVARTVTRTASWRIPGAGTYPITVRPYSPEGAAGVAASLIYTTRGADAPPVLVDFFDVEQLSGGVRRYTWGFFSDTIQSANFAGVEIRYAAGAVEAPNWNTMTPLGDDGYHPSAFEAVLPEAGQWTFAIRSRNTAGTLSTGMLILVKELQANLGEVIGGLGDRIDETYEQALAANNKITQEILDRVAEDLRVANEAVAAARAYTDAQVAALNGILEDIVRADEWAADGEYPAGDFVRRAGVLYRALADNAGVEPGTNPAVWQAIGEYTSVGDALAAAISLSTQNATDLQAEAARLDALLVRMPAGEGALATAASVAEQIQVVANKVEAIARRTSALESALPDLATNAHVRQLDEAQTNVSLALARRIDQTNAALAGKAEAGTVQQIQSRVELLDGKIDSNAQALLQVRSQLGSGGNLLTNAGFEADLRGWSLVFDQWGIGAPSRNPAGEAYRPANTATIGWGGAGVPAGQVLVNSVPVAVTDGLRYCLSVGLAAHRCRVYAQLIFLDGGGQVVGAVYSTAVSTAAGGQSFTGWDLGVVFATAPGGAVNAVVRLVSDAATAQGPIAFFIRPQLEVARAQQTAPSPWQAGAMGLDSKYATVTQILETRATQLENGQTRLEAKAGVLLDVNGRVIGWRANNDGSQGIFDIVADRFNVTDPNGTGSTTFEQGRWITRSGGFMSVHGKPFGTTGDLMMYIGVGSDPTRASKSSGIFWIDNKGNAYFGGSLSAGVLRNAVQTGTTQTVGAELLNGPFRTNGGNRTVTLSFARTHQRQRSASGGTGFVAGAGANTAQVQLFRQIGTSGWVLWQVLSVTGSVNITNETDGPDTAVSGWSGSFTVNDSSSPQETVSYLARVVAFGEQAVTHQAGSFDAQTLTQNLSIISVEQ